MLAKNKTNEDFLFTFFESKGWRIARHIVLIVVLYIVLDLPQELNKKTLETLGVKNPELVIIKLRESILLIYFVCLAIIYTNLFLLVPRLLFKNKFAIYLFSLLFLVTIKYGFELLCSIKLKDFIPTDLTITEFSFQAFVASCTMAFVFLVATAGYKVFKKWVYDSKQFAALKEATLKEELSNLKNQINPHFLFNTLNNLNTLIDTNTTKASAVVLGLSDVLRFYLYEADKEKIFLKKDIEILTQVLELEKIRRDNFQFSINTERNIIGVMVPPFIFTNFIENAIKHSVDNNAFSYVHIIFSIENNKIIFECENSTSIVKSNSNYGGLGLQNIKRRLELLYKNNYQLEMNEVGNKYSVKLEIPL
jgi:sensor histidine kinase YesM